jgi:hypothetical protein
LQHWLREFGPNEGSGSLFEFAAGIEDTAVREGIYALDSVGFRPNSGPDLEMGWNGAAFWRQFEHWRKNRLLAERENSPPLTDLYATENRASR